MESADTIGTAMELIANAGDSRSFAMEAIMQAKGGDIVGAREALQNAKEAMVEAHDVQTELLRAELSEDSTKKAELTLLMVHAQDHLTMALLMRDIAAEFIDLYETLEQKRS